MSYSLNHSKFLNDTELSQLRGRLNTLNRDTVLIQLALSTGARESELLHITQLDLNTENHSVFIRGLKKSRDREIPLTPELFSAVKRFVPFSIHDSTVRRIWYRHRPVKKKFHSLRHTFAIQTYKRTKDIKLVQLALGHVSIMNTQIYVDFLYNQTEMKRILIQEGK